jgi:IclR family acetate operon transcriptional repressor
MSSRDRALNIVELLAHNGDGLPLSEISERLSIPRSATHRLLGDLREMGYVRQEYDGGIYRLTVKIASLALAYCSTTGLSDLVPSILDQLARKSGELAMLSVLEGENLMRVLKVQGARRGLMYNADEAGEVHLATTANGHAFLSALSEEEALELVARQGIRRVGRGPNSPKSLQEVMAYVARARERGYAIIHDLFEPGTSAIAVPVLSTSTGKPIATMSVAGPTQRLGDEQLERIAPILKSAAGEMAFAAARSTVFGNGLHRNAVGALESQAA